MGKWHLHLVVKYLHYTDWVKAVGDSNKEYILENKYQKLVFI